MIFRLGWSWHDEGWEVLFSNATKNSLEFEYDCKEAIRECAASYLEQEKGNISIIKWMEFAVPYIEKRGYKKVEPVDMLFVGCDLFVGRELTKAEEKNWKEWIGEEAFNLAIKKCEEEK